MTPNSSDHRARADETASEKKLNEQYKKGKPTFTDVL
jgi:hypothetical protein